MITVHEWLLGTHIPDTGKVGPATWGQHRLLTGMKDDETFRRQVHLYTHEIS